MIQVEWLNLIMVIIVIFIFYGIIVTYCGANRRAEGYWGEQNPKYFGIPYRKWQRIYPSTLSVPDVGTDTEFNTKESCINRAVALDNAVHSKISTPENAKDKWHQSGCADLMRTKDYQSVIYE